MHVYLFICHSEFGYMGREVSLYNNKYLFGKKSLIKLHKTSMYFSFLNIANTAYYQPFSMCKYL